MLLRKALLVPLHTHRYLLIHPQMPTVSGVHSMKTVTILNIWVHTFLCCTDCHARHGQALSLSQSLVLICRVTGKVIISLFIGFLIWGMKELGWIISKLLFSYMSLDKWDERIKIHKVLLSCLCPWSLTALDLGLDSLWPGKNISISSF